MGARRDEAPAGYMTTAQVAFVLRINRRTMSKQINRAIRSDLRGGTGTKRTAANPCAFAMIEQLRKAQEGKTQAGWDFPAGLVRIGGRWCFPVDSVRRFLEVRAARAQAAAKAARQDLEFFQDRFNYQQD